MNRDEKKYYQELLFLLVFMLVAVFMEGPTGNMLWGNTNVSVSVSINNRTDGRLSAYNFNQTITIFDREYIDVEFQNTGTNPYNAHIEIRVYRLVGNFLNLSATYQDSTVILSPADRRAFATIYVSNITGLYFIQTRVFFSTRTLEEWQSFRITNQTIPTPCTVNCSGGGGGGGGPNVTIINPRGGETFIPGKVTIIHHVITPDMVDLNVTAPERIDLHRGDSVFIDIRARNTGIVNLSDLRLTVSSPSSFGIEIYPKIIPVLAVNSTAIFLISLDAQDSEIGPHEIEYFIVGGEITRSGVVEVNVIEGGLTPDEIRERIINYQILINDISEQILDAKLRGFDTLPASAFLDSAKRNLEDARHNYELGDYLNAIDDLAKTKKDIEQSLFLLAISMAFHGEATVDLFWLFIIILIIIAAILIYYERRRRKQLKRRPGMLKAATEQ